MSSEELFMQLSGATEVATWFGGWPSLHDAVVVELTLRRSSDSFVVVHGFRMNRELDDRGQYACDKHSLITFALHDVTNTELLGFNNQNVVSGLIIQRKESGYRLILGGCYGLEGWIEATDVSVSFVPGVPAGSVYESFPKKEFCS